MSTIIHEGGHGILEQNVNSNLTKYECMTCEGINALHESQSRFLKICSEEILIFGFQFMIKLKKC